MKKILKNYFNSIWSPTIVYLAFFLLFVVSIVLPLLQIRISRTLSDFSFQCAKYSFFGIIVAAIWNFIKKRGRIGGLNLLLAFASGIATVITITFLSFATLFGPSEDGFADDLELPQDIILALPKPEVRDNYDTKSSNTVDQMQKAIREALQTEGNSDTTILPNIPSLRDASATHSKLFQEYIEASPDWHIFIERGNRFASRRWSYNGTPKDTLHGYISDFNNTNSFQTRSLLCLDRKQWSRYSIHHYDEGSKPIQPKMTMGNRLHESRIMIDCEGVWIEIFEQSVKPERRITNTTITFLEQEFNNFLKDPSMAVKKAKARSAEQAKQQLNKDEYPFQLINGMQPGIYKVAYFLNPGEAGVVYLKAFEITQSTALSAYRLEEKSKTRITWSNNTDEVFSAKAGFTIYEGDWGKPYGARFEVWFKPDSNDPERKLAERNFKIEGWQR
ncbi:MAG: hypothetical protein NE334_01150 [Lentisphaeraceae bacterium]|nr:hypothetical protein [Lentisphaeraceae bacterium]